MNITAEERRSYDHKCFVCGKQNPIGLKLEFEQQGQYYVTYWQPQEQHQGYPGIVHGGLISTVLDEIMGRYLFANGVDAPTAELTIRFKLPVPVGNKLTIKGRIVSHKGRVFYTEAELVLENGQVAAEGKATFIVPKAQIPLLEQLLSEQA